MILNTRTTFEPYENFPTKFSDLNWNSPDVRDPRYLYAIKMALFERIKNSSIGEFCYAIPDHNLNFSKYITINKISFIEGDGFNYHNFYDLYVATIPYLFNFINIDSWSRALQYLDNSNVATTKSITYSKSDVDTILGYSIFDVPKPFQPYTYYSKYLLGMKKAIEAMNWIFWKMLLYHEGIQGNETRYLIFLSKWNYKVLWYL